MQVVLRRVGLDSFPATSTVKLHPVVLAVFNLASVLQGLGEEIAEEVVVGGVLEAEVANIREVLVKFLCL